MRIQLDERDRKRYQTPEVIEYDEMDPTVGEIVALEEQVGLTFDAWRDALLGDEVPSDNGGDPTRRRTYRTHHVILWLAVRRAGASVAYKDFDVAMRGLRILDDEVAEPGKEPDPDESGSPDSPATSPT